MFYANRRHSLNLNSCPLSHILENAIFNFPIYFKTVW